MPIMRFINWVPGGLMVVPLLIGMLINTFTPNLLKIGGFTEGLSSAGYNTALGIYLFTVGTKMTLNAAPRMLKRGFGIMAVKLAIAILIALAVARLAGGSLFGFSTLALMVAFSDTNGGMFMALTSVMGDEDDVGTYVPQSIETGPFITMLFLVGAGLANIPWIAMVSVVGPLLVGLLHRRQRRRRAQGGGAGRPELRGHRARRHRAGRGLRDRDGRADAHADLVDVPPGAAPAGDGRPNRRPTHG